MMLGRANGRSALMPRYAEVVHGKKPNWKKYFTTTVSCRNRRGEVGVMKQMKPNQGTTESYLTESYLSLSCKWKNDFLQMTLCYRKMMK